MNIDVEIAEAQRNQFAHYLVQLAVAMGIVDGKQGYTGEQVAFLAETALEHVCKLNRQYDPKYAAEREALLKAMPKLRKL